MRLRFTKMQGAGNDFLVLNGIERPLDLTARQAQALADRRFGVGADQILVVERATDPSAEFRYRIFNADGGEVEQSGNGARCFARYARQSGLTSRTSVRVQTAGGLIELRLLDDGTVSVDMGPPDLDPAASGFSTAGLTARTEDRAALWPLAVNGRDAWVTIVSMGNPHAVQRVEDADSAPVEADGPAIERHARFAGRVNAGFMQVLDRRSIRLRVWERGAGETLACGTGACAAVVAGIERGLLSSPVAVRTRGGRLDVSWAGGSTHPAAPVFLTGPAVKVFEGEIDIE
ncbi:MAG TPA: diaminopimelate epimerase [Burkholderiaceae bacterium]|nr:diaminopimelate epimerase [Burkholderiaceae bacterium]